MNSQYRKNLKDAMTACKNYTDKSIQDLKWELGANDLSLQTDNTIAYQKTVPTGAIGCKINKLGFMSYKSENLIVLNDVAETTDRGITYSISNGTVNVGDSANANLTITLSSLTYFNGTYTLKNFGSQTLSNSVYFVFLLNGEWSNVVTVKSDSGTITLNGNYVYGIAITSGTSVSGTIKPMIVKGSTAPTEFKQGFTGIRDSVITSVKSYDSNNNLIDTYTIDSNIQALEGYGRGINNNCYNVLDMDTKAFTDKDDKKDLGSFNYTLTTGSRFYAILPSGFKTLLTNETYIALCSIYNITSRDNVTTGDMNLSISKGTAEGDNSNYVNIVNTNYNDTTTFKTAMSGVPLQYERNTYNTTNVSQYLTNNNIQVEAGGYLVFENQYGQAVPSDITYLIEVAR